MISSMQNDITADDILDQSTENIALNSQTPSEGRRDPNKPPISFRPAAGETAEIEGKEKFRRSGLAAGSAASSEV